MIRFLAKTLKTIIIVYLVLLFMIFLYFVTQRKIYEVDIPTIAGYSYIHYQTKYMDPIISNKEFVLIKKTHDINLNDYVAYSNNGIVKIKKVVSMEEASLKLNYINKSENETLSSNEIYGKVIYQNKTLSNILNVLTNYVTILAMLIYILVISSYTYKRYQ